MLKLWPWHEAGGANGGALRGDPEETRQWLEQQLMDDADTAQARGYASGLADGTELSRLDKSQVKDHLSAALMQGRWRTDQGTAAVLRSLTQAARPAAAAPPAAAASSARPAPAAAPAPAAETTFGPDLDVAAQVAALKQAARDGVHFCEECAKAAARRAQAGAAA